MAILLKTWKVWLPVALMVCAVGWLFSWRADYAEKAIDTYKENLTALKEIQLEKDKQEIREKFYNGTSDVITGVVTGMLNAEGLTSEAQSNRLRSPGSDPIHADEQYRGSPEVGSEYGFNNEQLEYLKRNPTLFKTGE